MSFHARQSAGMGLYRHYTVAELQALRDRLMAALHARLTGPSAAASNGRSLSYGIPSAAGQTIDQLRKELAAVNAELDRRNGGAAQHRPIYLV